MAGSPFPLSLSGKFYKPKFADKIQALHRLYQTELPHLYSGNQGKFPLNDAIAVQSAFFVCFNEKQKTKAESVQ